MMKPLGLVPLVLPLALAWAAPLAAGDQFTAWGTTSSSSNGQSPSAMESSVMHQNLGLRAQQNVIGRNALAIGRSVSACGVCITYQITGDQNSITGNTASGTNSGAISANGAFNVVSE